MCSKQSKLVKLRHIGRSAWLAWGLGAAFFFSEYFARVSPSVMANDLMQHFSINTIALGSLSAFFYYAYIAMQLPVGMLVDRYGPHKLLTGNALICALGAFIFSQANTLILADVGRLLMGFGAAFAFVGSLKLASAWFPLRRFGMLAGLTQAMGMLGAAIGEGPMAVLVHHLGWQKTMLIIASVFLILAILMGIFVRDFPANHPKHNLRAFKERNLVASLGVVIKNKYSWVNAGYVAMLYGPTAAFAELWGVSFLQHAYPITTVVAASVVGFIFLGWGVGGPLVGALSDYIGRRKPVAQGSAIASFIILTTVIYAPHLPFLLVYVLLFLYGMCNTGVAISYALASEINPRVVSGTSMAFANMASIIIGALSQPVIGIFLVLQWNGIKVHGVPLYTANDYRIALLVLPLFLMISIIFSFFLKESYCQSVDVAGRISTT